MKVFSGHFVVDTLKTIELVDITSEISRLVSQSGIKEGLVTIYSPHTTTAVVINENESRLIRDIEGVIRDLILWEKEYGHNAIDNNAPAHIVGTILGCNANIPVASGLLELGTWQSVFLLELDGPRRREIKTKIIGKLR